MDYSYYGGGVASTLSAMWFVVLIVALFMVFCWWGIFTKAGEPGWAAIVPIYNTYELFKITWGNGLYFLLLFVPFVNIAIWILTEVKLAKVFGKSDGFALGLIFLTPVFLLILAFGDAQYVGVDGPVANSYSRNGNSSISYTSGDEGKNHSQTSEKFAAGPHIICPAISLLAGLVAIGVITGTNPSADTEGAGYGNGNSYDYSNNNGNAYGDNYDGDERDYDDDYDDDYESSGKASEVTPTKAPTPTKTPTPTKAPTPTPTEEPDRGQILPESSSRYLQNSDVQYLSQDELQTAINEIYARHGYIFETKEIYDYFCQFDWYHPTTPKSSFNFNEFSDLERKNIELLTSKRR